MNRAQYCPDNSASVPDHVQVLGWTWTHIPAEQDATSEGEMWKSIVVGKMVHVVIHLGLCAVKLDAVVEV